MTSNDCKTCPPLRFWACISLYGYLVISALLAVEVFPIAFIGGPRPETRPATTSKTVLALRDGDAIPPVTSLARWFAEQRLTRHVLTAFLMANVVFSAVSHGRASWIALHTCAWVSMACLLVNLWGLIVLVA
jgi:hypothetical protein